MTCFYSMISGAFAARPEGWGRSHLRACLIIRLAGDAGHWLAGLGFSPPGLLYVGSPRDLLGLPHGMAGGLRLPRERRAELASPFESGLESHTASLPCLYPAAFVRSASVSLTRVQREMKLNSTF